MIAFSKYLASFLLLFLSILACTEDSTDFTLTVTTLGNGSVSREKLDDRTWLLTAQPQTNFEFLNWSGDVSGTDNPIEITLDSDKVVTANFEADELLIIQVSAGGSYELNLVSSDNGIFVYELSATPSNGYEFVKWKDSENEYYTRNIRVQIEEETIMNLDFADSNAPFEYSQDEVVKLNSEVIWGLDALNNDHLIFTAKSGKIYALIGNQTTLISDYYNGVVNSSGQGGLLDISLDPDYEENKFVYVTYSKKIEGSNFSFLALDRFRYENQAISDIETIFITSTSSKRNGHFGSRISFSEEHIYVSIGEGSPSEGGSNSRYRNAQDLSNDWGKIHRLNRDGTVPEDNPFYNAQDAGKTIYSFGHRNPQGLFFHPYESSTLSTEHGPRGGDELNVIRKGLNYGWPFVSYGENYNGTDISGRSHDGYEKPAFFWDPSIATSQAMLLSERQHKSWFKDILVAGLKSKAIHRLESQNGSYQEVESLRLGYRVRSLCAGEDGVFFVSSDSGSIVKFTPNN